MGSTAHASLVGITLKGRAEAAVLIVENVLIILHKLLFPNHPSQ